MEVRQYSGERDDRVEIVDALRGFAAIAVALFHFTHGNPAFMTNGVLPSIGTYGWAGVDVFFVISGFVIPFSLRRTGYQLRNYFVFLARRIVRLDPPYLMSIAIVIALSYLSSHAPGFAGEQFSISWRRLLLHVGYLNDFFGVPWYGAVYWTLALELQFYLLMGLLFPLIATRRGIVASLTLVMLGITGLVVHNSIYVIASVFPFLLGMIAFRWRAGMTSPWLFIAQSVAAAGAVFYRMGPIPFVECLIAWAAISFVTLPGFRVLKFLGAISYSLYLLHVPIGGRVINIATRLELGPLGKFVVVCAAFAVSIAGAYLLHRIVEVPAQRWSRRFAWAGGSTANGAR